jgi:diguanylate cyclase (GGDEF)-like protein
MADVSRLVLKHYTALEEMGLLASIQGLQQEVRDLRKVILAAKNIANQSGIINIIEEVAKVINDRFVPASLVFVLENDKGGEEPEIILFRNMIKVEPDFSIPSLEPYRFFFNLAPMTASFPVFSYMIGRTDLTTPFAALKPAIVVPIMGFNQTYGFILVGEKVVGAEYARPELEFIDSVMQFASIGLQNNIHYLKAITDLKTRLYNNAYIRTRLDMELARVKRYKHEIAVIITDVDHFKVFNDTYGHLAGDKILMRIAEIFLETIRKGDIAGRFGGEEFVLVLAQCSKDNACLIAERVRRKIEALVIEDSGRELRATISLGVRHVNADTVADADTIIRQADKALYKAKTSGRNKSFLYGPAPKAPVQGA